MKTNTSKNKNLVKRSKNKKLEKKYQKMSHREHIYTLTDSYIGSADKLTVCIPIFKDGKIISSKVTYVPGLYKIVDEILVNAVDQVVRLVIENKRKKKNKFIEVDEISVNIDKTTGRISVLNTGEGIDVAIHPEHKIYIPEMIFGNLLTSTNYDENEEKVTGGKNGYGAKLTNIFSTEFTIETVDRIRKKKYFQLFKNNMKNKQKPVVTDYNGKPFTRITFIPDYKRFNMTHLEDDIYSLIHKRVYDIAAWTNKSVTVKFNGFDIPINSFESYANLYIPKNKERVYEKCNSNWEIIATYNDDETFEQVSFVNGINTIRGGRHVDYIVKQISTKLAELIKKKKKINVKPIYVKNQLMVFVKSTIVNPSFDGQTKETLTTCKSKFGSECIVSNKFITQLAETDIIDRIIKQAEYKNSNVLKKTDGKKQSMIRGIPKLTDANKAGTKHSKQCTLILTEGDSAKTMAISGLSEVGRDLYGAYPLRGKLLNVKDAKIEQISKNKEILELKKILGLRHGVEYKDEDNWPLRYGKIMIMTDQDCDGSHIKGLIMNFFHAFWPSLLEIGFVTSLITPIIKVSKKKTIKSFYNLSDYEKWKSKNQNGKGWHIKYYKGLGTSTSKEAKEYFQNLKIVSYNWNNEQSTKALNLAFNKKKADDRKYWLQSYKRDEILDSDKMKVNYEEFIEKELKHFSNSDLNRSIPSVCDGFKPSQRKVMFSCFKRNLKKEIKVAQLAGYVSEHSAYHHGETSLQGTIINLAQNYTGSNNINLLKPNGQFGTRIQGGKDSASPRYIFTQLSDITSLIFRESDFPLLDYLNDDGVKIEPEYYIPILPTILVNGAQGIGTGYSTTIPNFNPVDIIQAIQLKLNGKPCPEVKPWYKGFRGTIEKLNDKQYISRGIYKKIGSNTIHITELPIGTWTEDYKQFLETLIIDKSKPHKRQIIVNFEDNSTECDVDFTLKFKPISLMRLMKKDNEKNGTPHIAKLLKLTSTKYTNLSNMHLYDADNKIKKYHSVDEILDDFIKVRYQFYVDRKVYILDKLQKELELINYRVKFINEIIHDTIDLRKKKKTVIYELLKNKGYPMLSINNTKTNTKINTKTNTKTYDYLIKMPLDTLTEEKIKELEAIHEKKNKEFKSLEGKSEKDIWKDELVKTKSQITKLLIPKKSKSLKINKKSKSNKTNSNKIKKKKYKIKKKKKSN